MLLIVLAVVAVIAREWTDRGSKGPGSSSPFPNEIEGVMRPIDGDSFRLGDDEVRMQGIDAPEGRQTCTRGGQEWRCGEDARKQLQQLTGGRRITCKVIKRDQHGRLLARCSSGMTDLNAGMVSSGMAVSFGGDYTREERAARDAKRGLWSGEFETPREWRAKNGVGRRE